jgi:hypothetical protein
MVVNPELPVRLTADTSAEGGFKVEVGYSDINHPGVPFSFFACQSNVSGCNIFATCAPDVGTDQVTLTITGDHAVGVLERTDGKTSCKARFLLSGSRQLARPR